MPRVGTRSELIHKSVPPVQRWGTHEELGYARRSLRLFRQESEGQKGPIWVHPDRAPGSGHYPWGSCRDRHVEPGRPDHQRAGQGMRAGVQDGAVRPRRLHGLLQSQFSHRGDHRDERHDR